MYYFVVVVVVVAALVETVAVGVHRDQVACTEIQHGSMECVPFEYNNLNQYTLEDVDNHSPNGRRDNLSNGLRL